MYEFDEQRWDQQKAETSGDVKGIAEGWLIQLADPKSPSRAFADQPLFLQIGTGQWCAANYATLFSLRCTAVVYAKEFGYVVGQTVRIVRHRF